MYKLLGFASAVCVLVSYVPYLKDIFANRTKPERASWFIWTALGLIIFLTQLAQGASSSLLLPGFETVFTLIVFILSIKFGTGGVTKQDILGLIAAVIGLIIWFQTKQPIFALLTAIFVDLVGTVLTIIKTYQDPSSETLVTWVLVSLAGILSLLSVGRISLPLMIYPAYIFLANGATVLAIFYGKARKFPN